MKLPKKKPPFILQEDGISLVELLVSIALLTIAVSAITGMLISSMRSQQVVTAGFRSQLNSRTAIYDMEKNISEAQRRDTYGNEPIFQDDLISFPSQNEPQWITYLYTSEHPDSSGLPTIVKVVTDGMPSLPLTILSSDKQLINVDPALSETATVERVFSNAPLFTYYDEEGNQMSTPVANPRNVRSVDIAFKSTVSTGHAQNEPTVSKIKINLRNF